MFMETLLKKKELGLFIHGHCVRNYLKERMILMYMIMERTKKNGRRMMFMNILVQRYLSPGSLVTIQSGILTGNRLRLHGQTVIILM